MSKVRPHSDVEIRVSTLAAPKSTDEVEEAPFVTVAPLKAAVGSMNYDLAKDVEPTKYKSIVLVRDHRQRLHRGDAQVGRLRSSMRCSRACPCR